MTRPISKDGEIQIQARKVKKGRSIYKSCPRLLCFLSVGLLVPHVVFPTPIVGRTQIRDEKTASVLRIRSYSMQLPRYVCFGCTTVPTLTMWCQRRIIGTRDSSERTRLKRFKRRNRRNSVAEYSVDSSCRWSQFYPRGSGSMRRRFQVSARDTCHLTNAQPRSAKERRKTLREGEG